MSSRTLKPLLVLGLRGTLLQRIHVRQIPPEMPIPDLTVGMFKVWLRPNILTALLELQKYCKLAIWSSTTARNTFPLVDAVFNNQMFLQEHHIIKPHHKKELTTEASKNKIQHQPQQQQKLKQIQQQQQQQSQVAQSKSKSKTSRLTKRNTHDTSATTSSVKQHSVWHSTSQGKIDDNNNTSNPSYIDSDGRFISPFKFQFVWTRQHTSPDYFRRAVINVKEDEHATLKDLNRVYSHFPQIATPSNTVLIDDTPSKARRNADNMLWLDTCEQLAIRDDVALTKLINIIKSSILPADDVREILPVRVRLGENASKLSTSCSGWTIEKK